MAEEWGKWVEHDGRGCPAGVVGKLVQCEFHAPRPLTRADIASGPRSFRVLSWDGHVVLLEGVASNSPAWDHRNFALIEDNMFIGKITRYRLRRPDALRQLIDLVENLPAPALDTVPREGVPA